MLENIKATPATHSPTVSTTWNVFAMRIEHTPNTYQSYLLRLWRDTADGPWRISLQSTRDGSQHFFATPEEAWAFLRRRLEVNKPPPAHRNG